VSRAHPWIVPPALVTVADMYAYLKLPPAGDGSPSAIDAELQLKIDAATSILCGYITDRTPDDPDWTAAVEAWTPQTAPPDVLLAIRVMTAGTFRFTGEDASSTDKKRERGSLPEDVYNLIMRFLDPTAAGPSST
jgi:hypothetical protein